LLPDIRYTALAQSRRFRQFTHGPAPSLFCGGKREQQLSAGGTHALSFFWSSAFFISDDSTFISSAKAEMHVADFGPGSSLPIRSIVGA
jgi:hypothetical protein